MYDAAGDVLNAFIKLENLKDKLVEYGLSKDIELKTERHSESFFCHFINHSKEKISFAEYQEDYDDRAAKVQIMFAEAFSEDEFKFISLKVESAGFDEYKIFWTEK